MSTSTIAAPLPSPLEHRHSIAESAIVPSATSPVTTTVSTPVLTRHGNKENVPLDGILPTIPTKSKKSKRVSKAHPYAALGGGNRRHSGMGLEETSTTSGGPVRVPKGRAWRRVTLACPWMATSRRFVRADSGSDSDDSGPSSPDSSADFSSSTDSLDAMDLLIESRIKELTESPLADVTEAYDESILGTFFASASSDLLYSAAGH